MQLKNNEYIVNKHMGDETITITRKALEEWRDHYSYVAEQEKEMYLRCQYAGKSDVLTEILKHFDND